MCQCTNCGFDPLESSAASTRAKTKLEESGMPVDLHQDKGEGILHQTVSTRKGLHQNKGEMDMTPKRPKKDIVAPGQRRKRCCTKDVNKSDVLNSLHHEGTLYQKFQIKRTIRTSRTNEKRILHQKVQTNGTRIAPGQKSNYITKSANKEKRTNE